MQGSLDHDQKHLILWTPFCSLLNDTRLLVVVVVEFLVCFYLWGGAEAGEKSRVGVGQWFGGGSLTAHCL